MAIYRETAHALFGGADTTAPTNKPLREPAQARSPQPAAKPFTRDTTVRTAPTAQAPTAESSFMAAPAFGERTSARRTGSKARPLIIAGLAGVIALGAGAVILLSNNGSQGVPTAEIVAPPAATPTPIPTPPPVETVAATPVPLPAPVEAAPVRRVEAAAPARRAAAPAARRAAPAAAATPEVVTPPTTGPVPYTSTTPAPAAVAPATPAPPPVIAPEPVEIPAPTPVVPEPTPVPQ